MDGDTTAQLIYLGLLAAAVGGWAIAEMRGNLGQTFRFLLIWAMIGLGLIAGYGLWGDVKSDLTGGQKVSQDGVITLPRAPDGHFYAELMIGETPVRFLVDTGASVMVIAAEDVTRIGIDLATLDFKGQAFTANGAVSTAGITLPQVAFGPFTDVQVGADVTSGDLDTSLLGMSYLSLFRIEVQGEQMTLSR